MEGSRSSAFHQSLHRPQQIMGIESRAFGALVMVGVFSFVARTYWGLPVAVLMYLIFRWLSKKEPQFIEIFFRYIDEDHVYDATPRPSDHMGRPQGWGKNLPM